MTHSSLPPIDPVHHFAHEAMATVFEIFIAGQSAEYARQAACAVFNEIDRLEKLLSRFDPGSDIAQINRLQPRQSVTVSFETFECLMIARQIEEQTGGAYDISVGPWVDAWRSSNRGPQLPVRCTLVSLRWEQDSLCGEQGACYRVERLPGEGSGLLTLDLGGLGKGYALDLARQVLDDWDVPCAMLHGGSSTALALGVPHLLGRDGQVRLGWWAGVGGEWSDRLGFDKVCLEGCALSGSGMEVKGAHIIDPRQGRPATHHLAAWVLCESATLSDVLSTALVVMSPQEAEEFCNRHSIVAAAVVEASDPSPIVRRWGPWEQHFGTSTNL